MGNHFMSPAMEGERPFKCYVCKKLLIVDIQGEYVIKLQCSRCKTKIILECMNPVPDILAIKHGELTHI
jgi:hypothetical protein